MSAKGEEAYDLQAPNHVHRDELEELGYAEPRSALDPGRQRRRRVSSASFLNPKNFLKEVSSRRKKMRQSIGGVVIFYMILFCLGSIMYLVLSHLYGRLMGKMYEPDLDGVPLPTQSRLGSSDLNRPFDTSLGCSSQPLFNRTLLSIPVGNLANDHTLRLVGGAFALVTLTSSPNPTEKDVVYDVVLSGNSTNAQMAALWKSPARDAETTDLPSFFEITTLPYTRAPVDQSSTGCVRAEVTVYVPQSLRRLKVVAETMAQISFAPDAHVELDELILDITAKDSSQTLVLTHPSVRAKSMSIQSDGWITGDITLVDELVIRSDNGTAKITVTPNAPADYLDPLPATLTTTTGGDMELIYAPNKAYRRRPIHSTHIATGVGEMALHYGASNFSGSLDLRDSSVFVPDAVELKKDEAKGEWTHYFREKGGVDMLHVHSPSHVVLLLDKPLPIP